MDAPGPALLHAIERFVGDDVWFDAFVVSCGLGVMPDTGRLRWVSQKLSNLHRLGRVERRHTSHSYVGRALFEYRLTREAGTASRSSRIPAGIG